MAPADVTELAVRGDQSSAEFMAFWAREGRPAAGLYVNTWDQMEDIQALIRSRLVVAAVQLADPGRAVRGEGAVWAATTMGDSS